MSSPSAYHDDDGVMIHPRGSLIRKARRCIELRFQRCVVTCLWQAWSQVRRIRAVSAHREKMESSSGALPNKARAQSPDICVH